EECPAASEDEPSCMITTTSGETVCIDDLAAGHLPLNRQASDDAGKPLGGDISAARSIVDPHPAFVGVAVDPINDIVVMADTNRKSVVSYDRNLSPSNSGETSDMRRQIMVQTRTSPSLRASQLIQRAANFTPSTTIS